MVTTNIEYQGELHCTATHAPSGASFATDAPKDNNGKGESFSPTDLVGTALGACMLTVMGITARKLNIDIAGATANVEKKMVASPVRMIGELSVVINFPMQISDEHKKQLEHAAHTCPVHKSLHPDVAIPIVFNWA